MSYQNSDLSHRRTNYQHGQDNYTKLDEDKKQRIIQDLIEEIERQKGKYLLKEKSISRPDEAKFQSNALRKMEINDLPSLTSQRTDKVEMMSGLEPNHLSNDNLDDEMDNLSDYVYSGEDMDHIEQINYEQENLRNQLDKEEFEVMEGKDEIFDRAKEKLMKIRGDLESMNEPNEERRNFPKHTSDKDIDDYLYSNIEEEQPKNLEHEISISNKSIRDDIKEHSIRYNFYNPLDTQERRMNDKFNQIQTRQRNSNTKLNKSKSSSRIQTNNRTECNERSTSPYMNKMIKKYNPRYKSKERFEKLKQEVEEKFANEHTFKPMTNYAFDNIDKKRESKDDLYRRLSTPKTIEVNNKIKSKEISEYEKVKEECTFKPNLNKNVIDNNKVGRQEIVSTRLHKLAEKMREKREKMKREFQEEMVKNLSFKPEIDEKSKQLMLKYEKKPIYQRYDEVAKSKSDHLQLMRMKMEQEERSLYKPEINHKSKEIAMNRSFSGSIHDRLYNEGIHKFKRGRQYTDQDLEECTFSPQIYFSTQMGGNIEDFLERQKIYNEIKKERLERKLSKSIDHTSCTFKPQINLTSEILTRTDHTRANEQVKDKIDRLYRKDFEKIKQRKEQIENFYYAQFDFKPKINEISRFIGKDHTYEDLNRLSSVEKATRIKEENISKEHRECTFKPKINKDKYEYVQSNYKIDDNILSRIKDELKAKNEKTKELKMAIEEKDKAECKFRPETLKEVPKFESNEPLVMKGMAKYLEQMEKARKAKREKEEREKEVFITGDNWSRDHIITIPKPFNLSYQQSSIEKKEQLKKKNIKEEMKECTFKPATNESKNKEIIKMILKD